MSTNAPSSLDWLTARPIAHRGLHERGHGIIENSKSAFAAAIDHDYSIECDVQISGDGEAIVFHDATLDRLTARRDRVDTLCAEALEQIELTGSTDRPQRLGQLLDQVDDRVPLVIELKSHWDGSKRLAKRVCDIVITYTGRAALMSFDPVIVAAIGDYAPNLPRGGVSKFFSLLDWSELSNGPCADLAREDAMRRANPHFMSYAVKVLTSPGARSFRATGRPVTCWTVRDAATAAHALKHCDQITFEGFLA